MSLETLDGPDWLDTQADRLNGQNRQRHQKWQHDQPR